MRFLHFLVLIAFLLLPAGASFAQTHFLFEYPEPFKKPVQLPTDAVGLLQRELQAASYCPNQTAVAAESLRASPIDLGRDRVAFIVRTLDDCFNGPDHNRFWIVLHAGRGYELVLQGGTVAVTVGRELTHGFPDIETYEDTGETLYREVYKFNGSVYNASLCTRATLPSRSVPSKVERVTCRTH